MKKSYTFKPKTEKPFIVIGKKTYFIDNRFSTAQKLFKKLSDNPEDVNAIYYLVFDKEDAKEIVALDLSVEDTQTLLTMIMALIRGVDIEEGPDGKPFRSATE
jgi:hypothetical protein